MNDTMIRREGITHTGAGARLDPVFVGWKPSDFEAFAPIAWERQQLAKAARRQRVADRAAAAEAQRQARKAAHQSRMGVTRKKGS
jgi:hypothetical protein